MRYYRILSRSVAIGLLLLLGACLSGKAPADERVALNVADSSVLNIDVANLRIQDESQNLRDYPHVGFGSTLSFQSALETWAHLHFAPTGNTVNTLQVTLRSGDITEAVIPATNISSWFKKHLTREYHGKLALRIAIIDPAGRVVSSADGSAVSLRDVNVFTSDAKKRRVWGDMVKEMFDNIDLSLLPLMRQSMPTYAH